MKSQRKNIPTVSEAGKLSYPDSILLKSPIRLSYI